jgi:1,4-alpha-glucan branching enzyme
MSIKKQLLKSKPICKVTFEISPDQAKDSISASVLGSFNEWQPQIHPLKRLKDGSFKTTIDLETGISYQFRYLLDDNKWLTDSEADDFVPSGFGTESNALIRL